MIPFFTLHGGSPYGFKNSSFCSYPFRPDNRYRSTPSQGCPKRAFRRRLRGFCLESSSKLPSTESAGLSQVLQCERFGQVFANEGQHMLHPGRFRCQLCECRKLRLTSRPPVIEHHFLSDFTGYWLIYSRSTAAWRIRCLALMREQEG